MESFRDRVAVVTGGGSGIGKSLDPGTVAGMVLSAMRADRLYVITHDESLEPLRRRFRRLEQAIHG